MKQNLIDHINSDVMLDYVDDLKFSATMTIVFMRNEIKPSIIEEFFPDSVFDKMHEWETCPIDGCSSCVYQSKPNCNHNVAIIHIMHFINSGLIAHCRDCSDERVLVTRKILAGTRVSTLELPGFCRVMFTINWS